MNIIPPTVAFVGPDGRIAREWYQFLLALFQAVGSGDAPLSLSDFEGLVLAASRPTLAPTLEAAIRDLAAQVALQRSPSTKSLEQRVADLEARLQAQRGAIDDPRVRELQTFVFGSRPWH